MSEPSRGWYTVGLARNRHNWSLYNVHWLLLCPRGAIISATRVTVRARKHRPDYCDELAAIDTSQAKRVVRLVKIRKECSFWFYYLATQLFHITFHTTGGGKIILFSFTPKISRISEKLRCKIISEKLQLLRWVILKATVTQISTRV